MHTDAHEFYYVNYYTQFDISCFAINLFCVCMCVRLCVIYVRGLDTTLVKCWTRRSDYSRTKCFCGQLSLFLVPVAPVNLEPFVTRSDQFKISEFTKYLKYIFDIVNMLKN